MFQVVELNPDEADQIAEMLSRPGHVFYMAFDDMDGGMKVKNGNQTWSPKVGLHREDLSHD